MACTPGETSVILDCICVNGVPLVAYIEAADLALQEQAVAALACCTTNSAAIAILQACCTTVQADIVALQALITLLQAQIHTPMTITNNARPFNFVSTTQTLNVAKGLHVVLQGIVTDPLPSFLTQLGVAIEFETVGANEGYTVNGMNEIIVPYDGLYHISGSLLMTGPTITLISGNDSARLYLHTHVNLAAGGVLRAELGDSYLPAGVHQFWGVQGATVRRLSTGDTLYLITGQSSQNALPTRNDTYGGLTSENYFEVTWLGD